MSDLHLTATPKSVRIDGGGTGGNLALARLMHHHQRELLDVDCIIITGDTTDRGDGAEWRNFFGLFPPEALNKVIIVPGNHDLNMALCLGIDQDMKGRMIRQIRWLLAADLAQGERSSMIDATGNVTPFRSYIHEVMCAIEQFVECPPRVTYDNWGGYAHTRGYKLLTTVRKTLESIFPLIVAIGDCSHYVIVLDSNDVASNIATNAFGRISKDQLERLRRFLASASEPPVAIALHHHLVPASREAGILSRLRQAPLGLVNAGPLLGILEGVPQCVILTGHQHRYDAAMIGAGCTVISVPSSTIGDVAETVDRRQASMCVHTVRWCQSSGSRLTEEYRLSCGDQCTSA